MKKINTSPVSGMQELLPKPQSTFDTLKAKIAKIFHTHGYLSIETPSIERTEILLAKAGGDTEKQIYKVVKTAESADSADQALRFDHTVPLARYIVDHENDLVFPFKVSQVGPCFRGERAQKGRFREFYQCDIDIIGRNDLPIAYDADVLATLIHTYNSLGIATPIIARISNRKILTGLLESWGLTDKSTDIYSIIDHSEKVPFDKTKNSFLEIGLSEDTTQKLLDFIDIHGPRTSVVEKLRALNIASPIFQSSLSELDSTMSSLESMGLQSHISADMKIVRGLDYYTGVVFEFFLPEYREIGSIGGGGRYDNLTGHFTDHPFPGVGGSIGLTRLFYVLRQYDLLPERSSQILDYAIIPVSPHEYEYSHNIASALRKKGSSVTIVLTDKKLSDKIAYAAKLAQNGIVVGESEVTSGHLQAKNFTTGSTTDLTV